MAIFTLQDIPQALRDLARALAAIRDSHEAFQPGSRADDLQGVSMFDTAAWTALSNSSFLGDLTGITTLVGGNSPAGTTQFEWSIQSISPVATSTPSIDMPALEPGPVTVFLRRLDASGTVLDESARRISTPYFAIIGEDATGVNNTLSNEALAAEHDDYIRLLKCYTERRLRAANIRIIWRVTPFNEPIPFQFDPASSSTTTGAGLLLFAAPSDVNASQPLKDQGKRYVCQAALKEKNSIKDDQQNFTVGLTYSVKLSDAPFDTTQALTKTQGYLADVQASVYSGDCEVLEGTDYRNNRPMNFNSPNQSPSMVIDKLRSLRSMPSQLSAAEQTRLTTIHLHMLARYDSFTLAHELCHMMGHDHNDDWLPLNVPAQEQKIYEDDMMNRALPISVVHGMSIEITDAANFPAAGSFIDLIEDQGMSRLIGLTAPSQLAWAQKFAAVVAPF